MGTSGALYLLMVVVAGTVFALGLAYYSWQHGRMLRERSAPAPAPARADTRQSDTHAHA